MAKKQKSDAGEEIKPKKKLQKQSSSESESSSAESEPESLESEEVEEENESTSSPEEEEEDEKPNQDDIKELLQTFSKDQLLALIKESISSDPSLAAELIPSIDADPVHRKIFVHGLGWDVTNETLRSAFKPFGSIVECRVVIDKLSGRSKGYGFVLFKSRAAALKSLKEPQKKIGSRMASCQLAVAGAGARRLQVANVGANTTPEKLRAFFEKFGQIEEGPLGFDKGAGKFKDYAIFVFKNSEGIRKALEEPVKVFDGVKLECSLAVEGRGGKNNVSGSSAVPVSMSGNAGAVPVSMPGLSGLAAGMNPGLLGQNFNAGALMLGQNPALGMILNSAFGMNPAGLMSLINPVGTPSAFVGGVSQPLNGAPNAVPQALNLNNINPTSVMGSYGPQVALQGLGAYQNQSSQSGQSSSSLPASVRPQSGSVTFPPYLGR